MISKKQVAIELKDKIDSNVSLKDIAQWAYAIYFQHCSDLDQELETALIDLFTMGEGPAFELSKEQLNAMIEHLMYVEEDLENLENDRYNKRLVVRELTALLDKGAECSEITRWALDLSMHAELLDSVSEDIVQTLDKMEIEGFEYTLEEIRLVLEKLTENEEDPFKPVHRLRKMQKNVGLELKRKIDSQCSLNDIAQWAHETYDRHCNEFTPGILKILLDLSAMRNGPEYKKTKEELALIIENLINEKYEKKICDARFIAERLIAFLRFDNNVEIKQWAVKQAKAQQKLIMDDYRNGVYDPLNPSRLAFFFWTKDSREDVANWAREMIMYHEFSMLPLEKIAHVLAKIDTHPEFSSSILWSLAQQLLQAKNVT